MKQLLEKAMQGSYKPALLNRRREDVEHVQAAPAGDRVPACLDGERRILAKDQVAPGADGYTGIGFRAAAFGNDVHLLTLETLEKKSDLYLRRISGQNGAISKPLRLKLSVADDQQLAYVKDFTTWLDAQNIIGVSRPSKKSAALRLNKVTVK